jgi:predicted nucleic acid-binding protein
MADEVIDSGVVMKWFVAEPHTPQALLLLDRCLKQAITLYAPDLLIPEMGNIAWKKRLYHGMTEPDAATILSAFSVLPITLVDSVDLAHDAYRIAVDCRRSFYDSLYVALSVQQGCPFISADEKLVNAVRPRLPNVTWLGDYS